MMFAYFHYKGTITSCSDMLNTCASGVLVCSIVYFSIYVISHPLLVTYFLSYC